MKDKLLCIFAYVWFTFVLTISFVIAVLTLWHGASGWIAIGASFVIPGTVFCGVIFLPMVFNLICEEQK